MFKPPGRSWSLSCFLLVLSLTVTRASAAIVLTPAVTPITAETFNGVLLLYNGSITATATGGTAPYVFTLTSPAGSYPQNNAFYPGLGPGTYTLSVMDANGQTASQPVTVSFFLSQPIVTASFIVEPSACDASD